MCSCLCLSLRYSPDFARVAFRSCAAVRLSSSQLRTKWARGSSLRTCWRPHAVLTPASDRPPSPSSMPTLRARAWTTASTLAACCQASSASSMTPILRSCLRAGTPSAPLPRCAGFESATRKRRKANSCQSFNLSFFICICFFVRNLMQAAS